MINNNPLIASNIESVAKFLPIISVIFFLQFCWNFSFLILKKKFFFGSFCIRGNMYLLKEKNKFEHFHYPLCVLREMTSPGGTRPGSLDPELGGWHPGTYSPGVIRALKHLLPMIFTQSAVRSEWENNRCVEKAIAHLRRDVGKGLGQHQLLILLIQTSSQTNPPDPGLPHWSCS